MHWGVCAAIICQLMLTAVVNIWWRLATVNRSARCVMLATEGYWLVRRAADDPDCLSSPVSLLLAQGQGLSDENRSSLVQSLWLVVCLLKVGLWTWGQVCKIFTLSLHVYSNTSIMNFECKTFIVFNILKDFKWIVHAEWHFSSIMSFQLYGFI